MQLMITYGSAFISIISVIVAYWALREAEKSNNIGRLNALLSLRRHYLDLMLQKSEFAKMLPANSEGIRMAEQQYANLDTNLREVATEIDKYHGSLVGKRKS